MTNIASVESRTLRIPLDPTPSFSTRTVAAREYTVVRVAGDDGGVGIGFCYGGHRGGHLVTDAIRSLLVPVLLGADAHRVEGLWRDMYDETLLHGRAGSVMRAISAVDIALWDRNARAANLPLSRFLGAVETERVPAYGSGGYYLDGKTPDDLAAEMRGYVSLGLSAVKMKIGLLDPSADAERLAAVRNAVGPDVLVMLDANNAWRDLPEALRALRRWEQYDPYWIEEPFSPDDIDSHARLRERTPVLVATGEVEAGRWRHRELLERGAAHILQTDAAVCGGITEFRRIAAAADTFGVTMAPHWFHDLHVSLVASTPNARFVEYFPDDQILNLRRVIAGAIAIDAGQLVIPTGPGLGFEFDFAALDRYSLSDWA